MAYHFSYTPNKIYSSLAIEAMKSHYFEKAISIQQSVFRSFNKDGMIDLTRIHEMNFFSILILIIKIIKQLNDRELLDLVLYFTV